MLRAIVAVIVGFFLIGVLVFTMLNGAALLVGMDIAYKPGVLDVTVTWLMISFIIGLLAASAGGLACAMIAKTATPVKVLVLVILILGYGMAFLQIAMRDDAPTARPPDMTYAQAMQQSREPAIALLIHPLIGMSGVMIGKRLARRKPASTG